MLGSRVDSPRFGPVRSGSSDKEALYEVDTDHAERRQLVVGLDALGEGRGAALSGIAHDPLEDRQLVTVAVDPANEGPVDLDEMRPQLEHMGHARVPRAHVVDG